MKLEDHFKIDSSIKAVSSMICSPIKYFGGKHKFLKYLFPFPFHKIYVEVFGGSAVVLLNKIPSETEIYNDINDELVNFWEIFRTQKDQFIQTLRYRLNSRTLFDQYKAEQIPDKLERAARFLYLNRHSFSGMFQSFYGISSYDPHLVFLRLLENEEALSIIWNRIKKVKFENQDFRKLIPRVDEKGTLLYLDPPYLQGGGQYESMKGGVIWNDHNWNDLKEILEGLNEAHFILSIDKKELFSNSNWNFQEVKAFQYATSTNQTRNLRTEYIIRNFKPNTQAMKDIRTKTLLEY